MRPNVICGLGNLCHQCPGRSIYSVAGVFPYPQRQAYWSGNLARTGRAIVVRESLPPAPHCQKEGCLKHGEERESTHLPCEGRTFCLSLVSTSNRSRDCSKRLSPSKGAEATSTCFWHPCTNCITTTCTGPSPKTPWPLLRIWQKPKLHLRCTLTLPGSCRDPAAP